MSKYDDWEHEDLVKRIVILEQRLRTAEARIAADSWRLNPDRMGGQFSQDEIDRARGDSW